MQLRDDAPLTFPSLGWIAGAWTEAHAVIPDRDAVGTPFRLYGEQLRYLVHYYRVRPEARPGQLAPAFHYRRGMLVRPQKWGKSPLIAAQVLIESVGPALLAGWAAGGEQWRCSDHGCPCGWRYTYEPGEPMARPWPTPLVQITATSEEQTANTFDALRPMIDRGPLTEVIPRTGEEFIRLPNGGRIDVVTSNARSRLGQRVTFCPQDEVGLWTPTTGMQKVADTQWRGLAGMGGRAALTTNGWDPAEASVAQLLAEADLPDVLIDHRQAPPHLSYGDKRERRRIHRHVYGDSLAERGGHVDLDSIDAEAAELVLRDPQQAARFFGNRIVYARGSWLAEGRWNDAERDRPAPPAGTEVCLGLDGSDADDWTVLRAETADGWQFTPTYGPDNEPTVWDPARTGGRIPRGEVDAAIDELHTYYRVRRYYVDPHDWWSELGGWSVRYGTAYEFRTDRLDRAYAALARFDVDLGTGALTHDSCPTTATHVRNARRVAKAGQRYLLAKPEHHQKIDAAMASVIAHEAASDARADGWNGRPADTRVVVFR